MTRWCMISQQTAVTNVALDWIRENVSAAIKQYFENL